MPTSQTPIGKTKLSVEGLGVVEGLSFPKNIHQFCGIPYASLKKRWTRSQLRDSWQHDFHDGTKLGCSAPNPPEYNGYDPLVPVDIAPHFEEPVEDELNCLVMNIATPTLKSDAKLPVMLYIHGGSFLFGGANKGVFDCVNLATYAAERDTPVVAINFNYRVGLGGFLASAAIKADMERDGQKGVGNFGLYDQQIALQWVNRYITSFGGDPDNVTIYGESAGGCSVSHHIASKDPAPFQRGIAMSGHLNTIPTWPLEHHERRYRALLTYLGIDADAPTALDQLRAVPEHVVAAATVPIEGNYNATGNPCDDGVFHATAPHFDGLASPPSWLKGYMLGDTGDEAMIFTDTIVNETYDSVRKSMSVILGKDVTEAILNLYGMTPEQPREEFLQLLEVMIGDSYFKMHNWAAAHRSQVPQTFAYHFEQVCTHDSIFKGLSYHALDLLYLFLNFDENLTPGQQKLARTYAGSFIDFAYGKDPWSRFSDGGKWMLFGPEEDSKVVTEEEDEAVRQYSRMKKIVDMGVADDFVAAVDHFASFRDRLGKVGRGPQVGDTPDKEDPVKIDPVGMKEGVVA